MHLAQKTPRTQSRAARRGMEGRMAVAAGEGPASAAEGIGLWATSVEEIAEAQEVEDVADILAGGTVTLARDRI